MVRQRSIVSCITPYFHWQSLNFELAALCNVNGATRFNRKANAESDLVRGDLVSYSRIMFAASVIMNQQIIYCDERRLAEPKPTRALSFPLHFGSASGTSPVVPLPQSAQLVPNGSRFTKDGKMPLLNTIYQQGTN